MKDAAVGIGHRPGIAYGLLIALGVFGGHRFYVHKTGSACVLLLMSVVQIMIVAATFMKPINPLYFWPPFDAFDNVHTLLAMMSSKPPPVGAGAQMIEEASVRPADLVC